MHLRTPALSLALATVALSPAAALAASTITKQSSLTAGDRVPAAIYGDGAKALVAKGDKLAAGQSLLRYRVVIAPKAKKRLTVSCASGKVRGFGTSPAGLGVYGPKLGAKTNTLKVGLPPSAKQTFKGGFFVLCG